MNKKTRSKFSVSVISISALLALASALLIAPAFFASKAGSVTKVPAGKALGYYDIRQDKGASDKIAGFRARSGRSAVNVQAARDEMARGQSELEQKVPTARVEYNDTMHIPEVIGPDPTQGRASLTGQVNSSRA